MIDGREIRNKRKELGLSAQQLADLLEVKKENLYKWERGTKPNNPEEYFKIENWLNGKRSTGNAADEINEPDINYVAKRREQKLTKRNRIPFFDAEASAGGLMETEMTPIHAPAGTIDIGDLLHDSQAAIRIYGNSMLPNYPPGCVVGLSKCNSTSIQPGEVYVIETRDGRLLKRLFYPNDVSESEKVTCYSDNVMVFDGGARSGKLAYPPFDIPKKEIINLFVVTGVIKRNANSIIINR